MKLIARLIIATGCGVLSVTAFTQTPVLLHTFNNPTPAAGGWFGTSMAALGNDRILVGARNNATTATNAGAVYLFHTNGTLLTTFTNPITASVPDWYYFGDWFGGAIATLGSDRVLIGSPRDQKVYLFTTNGTLLMTFTNPRPTYIWDYFGQSVAAVGDDRILIGAPGSYEDPDTWDVYGAAYLYDTNGALLTTFANLSPGEASGLGFSVAAFGSDRVLIGSSGYGPWAAYLFHTNGTRLMTFTNPGPQDYSDIFGNSVAAVGTDRVLIGAPAYGTNAGAVLLFNTNGTLLKTITNPTPAVEDRFGFRMAMLGSDRVVVDAPLDDTTGTNEGSAYMFSVGGTLLATLNNPAPAPGDFFGYRLAAFGNECVIIGAPFAGTGAEGAGSAYLFSIPALPIAPSLMIQLTASNTVAVSWPSTATGFVLQQNTNGIGSVNWSNVTATIHNDGTNQSLVVNPSVTARFYRHISP